MSVDHGPRHGADDGQANRTTDLLAGVEHAGGYSLVLIGYPGHQGHGERHEDQPGGGSEDDQRQADASEVVAVLVDAGQPEHSGRSEQGADGHGHACANARHQFGADPGYHDERGDERQVGQAAAQRAVSPDDLGEQREEEEHAEEGRGQAEQDQVDARPVPVSEDPQGQQRLLRPRLDDHERGDRRGGPGQGEDGGRVSPVGDAVGPGGTAGEAIDEQRESGRPGDGAGQVPPTGVALRFRYREPGAEGEQQADGHVDEEHPPPGRVGGQ